MSVTFGFENPEYQSIPCPWCAEGRQAGYIKSGERCIPSCDGTDRSPVTPEINWANGNAHAVMTHLGLNYSDGMIEPAAMRALIIKALNSRIEGVEGLETSGGHAGVQVTQVNGMPTIQRMGAAMVRPAITPESIRGRLDQLMQLTIKAQEAKQNIVWG